MKKLKLLLAACALFGVSAAWAQTDVTSTYLQNPSFEYSEAGTASTAQALSSGGTYYGWNLPNLVGSYVNISIGNNTTCNGQAFGIPNAKNGSFYYFNRRGWNNSSSADGTLSTTMTSVPVGHYEVTVWYKGYEKYNSSSSTAAHKTNGSYLKITVVESASTLATVQTANFDKIDNKDNTTYFSGDNNWKSQSLAFDVTTQGNVTLNIIEHLVGGVRADVIIDHVTLTYVPFANATDYSNLNSAISTVEGKTWGFDEGEYAPYNYVEVLEALAAAKAINQSENNPQTTVQSLTSTLNGADWSSTNAAEVNAFYDGNFSAAASVSTNTCPTGWHGSDSHYTEGYWVRLMYSNGSSNTGLQHFANSCAMMAKSTPRYGLDPGYTMPLNAATYYKLSFDFAGWGGGNTGLKTTIVVTDGSDATISVVPAQTEGQNQNGESDKNAWKTYRGYFKTGDAGNYKLLLSKTEGDGSGYQITYGDMVLKTLTVAEATAYYNAVKDEVDDSYDDGANGGSEKTAFKAAIDASVPATVDEIMDAAAALYTLRDAFVAATPKYDAFESERASAIALGVNSSSANAVTMTTASQLQEKLQALYVLEDAAVTAGYSVDATTKFGSWTTLNMETTNGEHWSGTSLTYYNRWQDNGFTSSITSTVTLPAGKYVFKLAARAQTGSINGAFNMSVKVGDNAAVYKDFVAKDNTGKGITTSGAVSYSDGEFCNGGAGRGWEWRFIGFELDAEASVTLKGYAQIYAKNWVGFADATLLTTSDNIAVLRDLLYTEITTATAIDKTTNVGTGIFQTPSSAVTALNGAIEDAQAVYDNGSATSDAVSDAVSDLQIAETSYKNTVNAPADGKKYYIKVAKTGHAKLDKAWLLAAGETSTNNPTGYAVTANEDPAAYFAQAFTFTQVSGNTYNISMTLPEGEVYLTYGSLNGSPAGWNKMQIQATTNSAKKGEFKIYAGNAANTFKIFNTEQNDYIDCQDGGSIYTDTGIAKELFAVAEASQASVPVTIAADVNFATRIFPFTPSLPDGLKAYSCEATEDDVLTLVKVDAPAANTPYILYAASGYEGAALTGYGTASSETYTEGLLTGVYTATTAPVNSYVLQNNDPEGVGFYQVESGNQPTVGANRCYLTVPDPSRKAFFFDFGGESTAINAINALTSGDVQFYNAAGARVPGLQKGMNIVKKADGKTFKVMVK